MIRHYFLTGEIQIGKSTIIHKTVRLLSSCRIGGFCSIKVAGIPGAIGSVYLVDAENYLLGGGTERLSDENRAGIRLGHGRGMQGFPEVFNHRGVELLSDSETYDLIIMDEIGRMEEKATKFSEKILNILDRSTPVLGVLRQEGDTNLQHAIRNHEHVFMIEVTPENRDGLPQQLSEMLRRPGSLFGQFPEP